MHVPRILAYDINQNRFTSANFELFLIISIFFLQIIQFYCKVGRAQNTEKGKGITLYLLELKKKKTSQFMVKKHFYQHNFLNSQRILNPQAQKSFLYHVYLPYVLQKASKRISLTQFPSMAYSLDFSSSHFKTLHAHAFYNMDVSYHRAFTVTPLPAWSIYTTPHSTNCLRTVL